MYQYHTGNISTLYFATLSMVKIYVALPFLAISFSNYAGERLGFPRAQFDSTLIWSTSIQSVDSSSTREHTFPRV